MSSTSEPTPPLVVLPVYGQVEKAARALRALDRWTSADVPLLVIDDHGAERVDAAWLTDVVSPGRPTTLVSHEENLGFVRTVNEAFAVREGRDVVVVNSDVVVFEGWLEGLTAAAWDSRTASVTATANRGSVASLPGASELQGPDQLEPLASRARSRAEPARELPVAVGHCVLLTSRALSEVGNFDEAFSPGYGEEVDWSIRAARAGWRHLAAPSTLVWHDGAASFGRRKWLQRRHELLLLRRYPREFTALRTQARSS
ncbi:hypothetical protein GCM10027517_24090 [Phycicoccus ginsengisoli]